MVLQGKIDLDPKLAFHMQKALYTRVTFYKDFSSPNDSKFVLAGYDYQVQPSLKLFKWEEYMYANFRSTI